MLIKKIKWMIAKEGLIVIGVGIVLYLLLSVIPNIPAVLPKYKLELTNGEAYAITISPELSQNGANNLIDAALNPPAQLVSKRAAEFIKDNRINSSIKAVYQINSRQVSFSRFVRSFFKVNFLVKLVFVYLLLLLIRFIIWANRILRRQECSSK